MYYTRSHMLLDRHYSRHLPNQHDTHNVHKYPMQHVVHMYCIRTHLIHSNPHRCPSKCRYRCCRIDLSRVAGIHNFRDHFAVCYHDRHCSGLSQDQYSRKASHKNRGRIRRKRNNHLQSNRQRRRMHRNRSSQRFRDIVHSVRQLHLRIHHKCLRTGLDKCDSLLRPSYLSKHSFRNCPSSSSDDMQYNRTKLDHYIQYIQDDMNLRMKR